MPGNWAHCVSSVAESNPHSRSSSPFQQLTHTQSGTTRDQASKVRQGPLQVDCSSGWLIPTLSLICHKTDKHWAIQEHYRWPIGFNTGLLVRLYRLGGDLSGVTSFTWRVRLLHGFHNGFILDSCTGGHISKRWAFSLMVGISSKVAIQLAV